MRRHIPSRPAFQKQRRYDGRNHIGRHSDEGSARERCGQRNQPVGGVIGGDRYQCGEVDRRKCGEDAPVCAANPACEYGRRDDSAPAENETYGDVAKVRSAHLISISNGSCGIQWFWALTPARMHGLYRDGSPGSCRFGDRSKGGRA